MAKETKAGATAPATLEEAVTQITELQTKLTDAVQKLSASETEVKTLSIAKETLEAELKDAAQVIEELKSTIALNKSGKGSKPVVEIGKKKYAVKAGTVIAGKTYTPEAIAADKKLCAELLEKGSKLLIEIE
jgi:chromosome segregation ATPase